MNNYPPHPDDPRYPNQKRPANQQPSWGNSEWGNNQGQLQPGDPYAPAEGYGQYEQQYGPYGQYAPPSQQPHSGYGQYGGQGQYGQFGSPSQYGQSQQGWEYGTPASQSQSGSYGQSSQYATTYQQSPYVPNAAPPPYGYPVPGQQEFGYGFDDAPPRKSRKGLIITLSIVGVVLACVLVSCFALNSFGSVVDHTASIAGTWYGQADIAGTSLGKLISTEAYMDLKQEETALSGSGKLCISANGTATQFMSLTITGQILGTHATLIWHDTSKSDAKDDIALSGSIANGQLSLVAKDNSGNLTLGAKQGTEKDYLAACRKLPTPQG